MNDINTALNTLSTSPLFNASVALLGASRDTRINPYNALLLGMNNAAQAKAQQQEQQRQGYLYEQMKRNADEQLKRQQLMSDLAPQVSQKLSVGDLNGAASLLASNPYTMEAGVGLATKMNDSAAERYYEEASLAQRRQSDSIAQQMQALQLQAQMANQAFTQKMKEAENQRAEQQAAQEAEKRQNELKQAELAKMAAAQGMQDTYSLVSSLLSPKRASARESASGFSGPFLTIPGTDTADYEADIDRLKSSLQLDSLDKLRGTGAITDAEQNILKSSATSLQSGMSEGAYKAELERIRGTLEKAMKNKGIPLPDISGGAPKDGAKNAGEDSADPWRVKR